MNKENNKGAAGLRRSAIAERIRLREEWSALKEIDTQSQTTKSTLNKKTIAKSLKRPLKDAVFKAPIVLSGRLNRQSNTHMPSEALRGVVALVEVGVESRALPLRAALAALGASVLPAWSPLVTHLIWAQGGCRSTRARARALASALVSPLWVEACAAAEAKLPERAFPAAARPSDLPSPASLRRMLKKADAENIALGDLLTDSDDKEKLPRLRISTETEQDTSADTSVDTSRDTSKDTSRDTSKDTSRDTSKDISRETSKDTSRDTSKDTTVDEKVRVNTASRRALPKLSESLPLPVAKSRRKLFTNKEEAMANSTDDEDENAEPRPNIPKPKTTTKLKAKPIKPVKPTLSERRELARAERIAKKFLAACTGNTQKENTQKHADTQKTPKIVLSGMCGSERRDITAAIMALKGRVQKRVNKRTTHVVLGSFQRAEDRAGITGITNINPSDISRVVHRSEVQKARTLSALCGAARGCRVLNAQWIRDSAAAHKWLHHSGYELPHLKKISQKARVERVALSKLHSEYAYDVFCGMRVFVTPSAEQRDAAIQLLSLCGAVVQNGGTEHGGKQNGGDQQELTRGRLLDRLLGNTQKKTPNVLTQKTQHATITQNGTIRYGLIAQNGEYDVKIGVENGEISSKWVFDSVASARMRTTRRYVNNNSASQVMDEMANFRIEDC